MNMLAMLNAKVEWQVSPHISRFSPQPDLRWVVEINDPLSGRSSAINAHFKHRSAADMIARRLNAGAVPNDFGFAVHHQIMD